MNKKGFTLIELLVAIILLSVLGLILGFSINNMMKKTTDREFNRFVDTVKSSASTYVSLNREAIEDLYDNRSFVYVKVGELIDTGLLDEGLKNPYTKEKIDREELIKVNLDAITYAIVITYPLTDDGSGANPDPDDVDEVTLIAMAETLDDAGTFNCMDGAGTYKLALSQEDGTLIHLANASGVLDGSVIKKYNINCTVPKEFTLASGERVANVDGSSFRSFKNYKVKEGTYHVPYTWLGNDGQVHTIDRVVTVKGKEIEAHFNGNNGTPSLSHINVINGAPYGTLATATRANHIFGGWYLDGTLIEANTIVYATETHTLKARWMKKPTVTVQGYHKNGNTMNPSNGYVYTDVATITYYGPEENDDTITYYLKSGAAGTTSVNAYSCGTGSAPGNCSSSGTKSIAANTWYKVGSANKTGNTNITVTYTAHRDNDVTLETYVSNLKNYRGAGNSITIRKVDRTNPTGCSITSVCSKPGNNGWCRGSISLTPNGSDAHSGIAIKSLTETLINYETSGKAVTETLTDAVGNSVTCTLAKENVKVDTLDPTCTSSNGYAWTTGNVTITGTCADTKGSSNSGCAGNVSKPYTTEGYWTNQSPGTVYDNAGNSTVCPANQTVGIDRTPPTCTSSTTNANWTNQNVTITGTCADSNGVANSKCTGNATRSFTSNTNSNESPGTVYDNAGNYAVCSTVLVRIDKTAPKCSTTTTNTNWTNQNVTITGNCTDTGGSECKPNPTRTFSSNTNSNESPGTVYDNAGNSATCDKVLVRVDKTPPTCTSSNGYAWTSGSVTLVGTCADTGGSGCTGNISKLYNTEGVWYNQSPGTVYDYAGNSKYCPETETVGIDRTAPQVPGINTNGYTSGNWTRGDISLTASASDNLSGISYYQYTHDLVNYGTMPNPWTINWDGQWNMYFRAIDRAGNVGGTTGLLVLRRDATGPTKPSINTNGYTCNTWTNKNVTLTLSASDATSGLSYYQYSHDGTNFGTFPSNPWEVGFDGGLAFVVRGIDVAENIGTVSDVCNVYIDRIDPTVSVTASGNNLSISMSDTTSGIYGYNVSTSASTPGTWTGGTTTSYAGSCGTTYYVHVRDNAGNTASASATTGSCCEVTDKVTTPKTCYSCTAIVWTCWESGGCQCSSVYTVGWGQAGCGDVSGACNRDWVPYSCDTSECPSGYTERADGKCEKC